MLKRIHVIINPATGQPDPEYTHHWQARQITIEADPPQLVQVDGEIRGDTPLIIQIIPEAVIILTPSSIPTAKGLIIS